ncbi:MAG: hypothetical protein NZT61_03380 [Deltaproteobacteria bacterium]|nr:hypothetical protein [Deltaproteobacteria bacterium]MCX7952122.1 hypothetical protein [Deltaproteobacteria bacterium]
MRLAESSPIQSSGQTNFLPGFGKNLPVPPNDEKIQTSDFISPSLTYSENAERLKKINAEVSRLNILEQMASSVVEKTDAIGKLHEMASNLKNKVFLESLAREARELSISALEKAENVLSEAEYASLLKPKEVGAIKETLERLITVDTMKDLPRQIEETWKAVLSLREKMLEIAESIRDGKRLKLDELEDGKVANVKLSATSDKFVVIHQISGLQSISTG